MPGLLSITQHLGSRFGAFGALIFKNCHFYIWSKYGCEYICIYIRKKPICFQNRCMKAHSSPPRLHLFWRFYDKFVVELWSSQLHEEQQEKMIAHHILPWCSCVIQGDYTDSRGISYWLPAWVLPTAVPPLWPPQLLSPACWLYGDLVCAEKSMLRR